MSKENSKILGFVDKISNFASAFEKIPNHLPEIITLILFPLLFYFFGYFHEPWFDEAQAWQIARCANYHDILFYLPHYEGHPPLWHLILSIFAKNNFPYEISLLSVSFVFSYLAVILIIFRAPFYRIVKILLPFTYFLFYQNGVISRPYCMIMLAFCFLAIFYNQKYEKPLRYAFSLIFLSLTHLYSFALSSFLALVWFIEGIKKKEFKSLKFILTCIILGFAYIAILLMIFPASDAVAINSGTNNSILNKIIYVTLILPVDCFISYICDILEAQNFKWYEMFFASFLGIMIWYILYQKVKNKEFLLQTLFIPYIPFSLIALKYLALQHLGVIFPFFIFIFWLSCIVKPNKENENSQNENRLFILFVTFSLVINLYWSFKSCILDMLFTYNPGKKEAKFIKEHNLDKYKVFADGLRDESDTLIFQTGTPVVVAPYLDKNIFYNFHNKSFEKNYTIHKNMTKEELKKLKLQWLEYGDADVILESCSNGLLKQHDKKYVYVFTSNFYYIDKGTLLGENLSNILVEKNLAHKLNLKEVTPVYSSKYYDLRHFTENIATKIILYNEKRKNK